MGIVCAKVKIVLQTRLMEYGRQTAKRAGRPNALLTIHRFLLACCDPSQCEEVRTLNEHNYRKWMVMVAAVTLLIAAIRLWTET
jgi:hypothetical protein